MAVVLFPPRDTSATDPPAGPCCAHCDQPTASPIVAWILRGPPLVALHPLCAAALGVRLLADALVAALLAGDGLKGAQRGARGGGAPVRLLERAHAPLAAGEPRR